MSELYELSADYEKRVSDVLLDTRPEGCADIVCSLMYFDADRRLMGTVRLDIRQQNDEQSAILKALKP